ncbi:hypothetical protein RB195_009922 [Necator americanus]|uniref:BHLH domain-containing protein n=1 Tax=Necator americanus TaxID=51031 RepID=A0ABR1CYV1_NECAM
MSEKSHEPIHSGHFMTSNPHTEPLPDDEDEDVEVDVVEDDDEKPNENGTGTSKGERAALYERPVTFYKFGPKKTQSIAIDVSLNKLNKCIKVAYNKMTTPKWKDFKGLRLHWKQRIRLNNVIWRAYYIEFRMPAKKVKKKTPFCYFAVPDDDTTHVKLEGSVLEGMYWKRRMEAVCAQYKKWRHYMKSRRAQERPIKRKRTYSEGRGERFDRDLCEPPSKREQRSQTPKNTSTETDYDDFENVFTDSLFESLNQPYMFPNPKEFIQSGNADIMQPGLLSLQPSLEEIMASLDRYEDEPNPSSRDGVMSNVMAQTASQSIIDSQQDNVPAIHPLTMPPQGHMCMSSQHRQNLAGNRGTSSIPRQAQDYAVASMLVDYSNQAASTMQMPTRQSSSITSQMLMMSSSHAAQPQYSTASVYNSIPSVPHTQRSSGVQWKGANFLLGSQDVSNTLEYVPQFLQSPPNILPSASLSMGCPPSTPSRPWWLDSPLTAAAQSPLAAVASTLSGGSVTPLGPPTPLGVGAGPSTPPSLLRSEIRSPVVVRTMSLQHSPDMSSILSSPSTLSSVDPQHHLSRSSHLGVRQSSTAEHRLESHMFPGSKEDKLFASLSPKQDWTPSLGSNLRTSGDTIGSTLMQNRSAPPTAEVRSNESSNPWKLSDLSDPDIYPQPASYGVDTRMNDDSRQSSSMELISIGAGSADKSEQKEEAVLMSAPSSVKPGRGGSRQVQADSTLHPEERKRILHLHAEQNRRSALKDGFDMLMDMIPDLHSGGVKPTNAVVLAKGAEHIRHLTALRDDQIVQRTALNEKIAKLNLRISALQSNLPSSTGTASSKLEPRAALEAFYDRYTKESSRKDYRFWVMARLLRPIAVGENSSFAAMIAPDNSSREEVAASCSEWLNNHWRAAELRPLASTLLRTVVSH